MKLLIGHDQSIDSDAAISDLGRAGLPLDTDVIVLSVVEQALASSATGSLALFGVSAATAPAMLPDYERQIVESARQEMLKLTSLIMSKFPSWRASVEIRIGSPVAQILARAQEWSADLIVVGSHGRSAIGRLFLGSASQDVVKEAHCSMRVGRVSAIEGKTPVRLVVGVDGSSGSRAAVRAVSRRTWPKGSEARVLAALNLIATAAPRGYLARIAQASEEELLASGLVCSAAVKVGESSRILIREAKEWEADCIFVGARGVSGRERILLGSTSAAVAANASCSVEVVRSAESCDGPTSL